MVAGTIPRLLKQSFSFFHYKILGIAIGHSQTNIQQYPYQGKGILEATQYPLALLDRQGKGLHLPQYRPYIYTDIHIAGLTLFGFDLKDSRYLRF